MPCFWPFPRYTAGYDGRLVLFKETGPCHQIKSSHLCAQIEKLSKQALHRKNESTKHNYVKKTTAP